MYTVSLLIGLWHIPNGEDGNKLGIFPLIMLHVQHNNISLSIPELGEKF